MATSTPKLAACLVLLASPAAAGEITGNGEYTPVHSYRASSICSFSGLNDEWVMGDTTVSQVQSYGALVRAFGGRPPIPGPGIACRG
ncbi:hypothetical protein OMW55_09150 [Sphingomonas sp. BN140010]|uniref:Uncharacterized protein n=1 Tax=Sphingomonas arvum TaxID=2992113 RepID=A0ABT3JG37_9SPHN|nr:hypothetical protein [Sphingomonas sp. BN140010]MCW3797969.1 hypothetical protein [Sphingomonas sp. BN140010]